MTVRMDTDGINRDMVRYQIGNKYYYLDDIPDLLTEIDKLQIHAENLRLKNEEFKKENKYLKLDMKTRTVKNNTLLKIIEESKEDENINLQNTIAARLLEIDKLERKVDSLTMQICNLTLEDKTNKALIEDNNYYINRLEQDKDVLEGQRNDLEAYIEEDGKNIEKLRGEIRELQNKPSKPESKPETKPDSKPINIKPNTTPINIDVFPLLIDKKYVDELVERVEKLEKKDLERVRVDEGEKEFKWRSL